MIFFHLKNCLFPSISRQRTVRFPRRIFFLRAFRFHPKAARFPCPFSNENQHSAQSLPLVFVRSSSPPRQCAQNFLCILYKTAENPPVIFYRCSALKPCIFSRLRGFERGKFRSTLNSATNPLRHLLRKCHLPLSCGARQGEALEGLRRIRTALQFLNAGRFYRSHSNAAAYKFGVP